jgi:hypothetical protein
MRRLNRDATRGENSDGKADARWCGERNGGATGQGDNRQAFEEIEPGERLHREVGYATPMRE